MKSGKEWKSLSKMELSIKSFLYDFSPLRKGFPTDWSLSQAYIHVNLIFTLNTFVYISLKELRGLLLPLKIHDMENIFWEFLFFSF